MGCYEVRLGMNNNNMDYYATEQGRVWVLIMKENHIIALIAFNGIGLIRASMNPNHLPNTVLSWIDYWIIPPFKKCQSRFHSCSFSASSQDKTDPGKERFASTSGIQPQETAMRLPYYWLILGNPAYRSYL